MTSEGSRVLMLVDDEPAQLRLVSALAQRAGWRTVTAASADMALARLSSRDGAMLDAVLIDSAAGDMSELISAMRARRATVPILLLTATGSVDHAVAAMRAGAADFLVKPIAPDRLLKALDAAVEQGVEGGELRSLSEKMLVQAGFDGIVGNTPGFRATLTKAAKAAATRQPILIEGEAGVGKETLAFAIHHKSPRSAGPFVVVHCGAIPANGIDSCLFGHEAGAFTGAFMRQIGKFAEADGGTLFLDQVDALPERAQQRVRQVLQSGEVTPLGGLPQRPEFRLISASDRLLEAEVEADAFDADLYHRLSLVHLQIPPLRERGADVPELCRQLLEQIAEQPGLRHFAITDDAIALLQGYDWPGNVRQLQAALFRAAVLGDGDVLRPSDFPHIAKRHDLNQAQRAAATPGVTLFDGDGHLRTLDEIEADLIRLAVSHYRGRMTEVARRLGIGRSTLYRKLAELGISEAA